MFKSIAGNSTAEIVEKKSKFIANIFYVESIEDAEEKIKEIKRKYYDARHNCIAYSIFSEDGVINRFSDDGEPSGTAGSPILNIINSKELVNILVLVTRYFGGILLGTGGLVRAYTLAFQEALKNTKEVIKEIGVRVKIITTYQDLEKLKYYLKQNEIDLIKAEYEEKIAVFIDISKEKLNELQNNKRDLNFEIKEITILEEKYVEKK